MGVCVRELFCHAAFGRGCSVRAKRAADYIRGFCLLVTLCLPLSAFPQTITDTDGTFNIVWSVTGSYNGGTFSHVLVKQTSPGPVTTVGGGSTTTGQVTLTRPNGTYIYNIEGCYTWNAPPVCHVDSTRTVIVSIATDPPANPPGTFTVPGTDGDGTYTISWSTAAGAATYELQELTGGTWSTIQNTSAISKSISGKGNGSYEYKVRACNSYGCSNYTGTQTTHVAIAPGIPASINVSPNPSSGNVTVGWGAASGSVTAYDLDYRLSSGSWISGYAGTALSAGINNLAVGNYTFQVRACKTTGSYTNCSGWRQTSATIMALPAPDAPYIDGSINNTNGTYAVRLTETGNVNVPALQEQINGGSFQDVQLIENYDGFEYSYHINRNNMPSGVYGYRTKSCNQVGCGYSAVQTVYVARDPGMPASLSISPNPAASGSTVTVNWVAPSGSANGYDLNYQINSGSWANAYDGAATSTSLPGLPAGSYNYQVRACYTAGTFTNCGSYRAASASIVVAPATPPAIFTVPATDGDGSYQVSWSTVSSASYYELEEQINGGSFSPVPDVTGTSKNFTKGNGSYGYRVRACNVASCSGYSPVKTIHVAIAPGVPASINISPNPSTGNVTASWGSASGSITEYDLDYQLGSGGWTNAYNGTLLTTSLSSLAVGDYNVQVRACKTTGSYINCSSWRTGTFTIMLPPATPAGLTAPSGDGDGGFTVSWSTASTATSYELQEQTDGGSFGAIQNTSATSRAISGKGNGSYGYRVRACNAVGCSAYSSVVTTHVAIAPGIPASINVSPNPSTGNVTISWGAATGSITEYDLDYQLGGGSWTNAYNGVLLSASLSNLAVRSYNTQVRACKTTGGYTNCSSWRTGSFTIMLPPATPAGLTAPSGDGDGGFTVSWNAASTATSYELQEQTDGGSFSTIQNTSATSKAISSKSNGSYGYKIRACNAVGCSAYSSVVTTHVAVAPGIPGTLNLSVGTNGNSIALSWSAASGSVTNYELQQRLNSGSWSAIYTGVSLTHISSNLGAGNYEYQVRACKTVGGFTNCSGWRNSIQGYVGGVTGGVPNDLDSYSFLSTWALEGQPASTAIQYVDFDGTFSLNWQADGEYPYNQFYEVVSDNPAGPSSSGMSQTSIQYNVLPDGSYTFSVSVCYEDELYIIHCKLNNRIIKVLVQKLPPDVPSNFIVPETSGNGTFTVSWDTEYTASYYVLEEQTNGGAWGVVQDSAATSKIFTGKASDSYGYRVKACNNNDTCSNWSAAAIVDVAIAPGIPSSFSVTPTLNDGDLIASWTASSGSVTYYDLDQKYDGGAWADAYVGANLSVAINNLAAGDYLYQLRACRTSGSFTQCSGWTGVEGALAAMPDAPVLNIPYQSTGSYSISWDEVLNINEYRLEEKFNAGTWAIIYQGSNANYAVTRPQGQYQYRASACNDLGCALSQVATLDVIGPPGVPGAINGPATDDDGMYGLSWGASTGIVAEYQLEERYNGGAWSIIYTGAATAYTATVSQVGGYDYQVVARNAAGESAYTAIKSVTVTINSSGTVNDPVPPVLASVPPIPQGIDESRTIPAEFDVGPGGQATYSIPILTAPGTAGMVPKVTLNYNSGGGNGLLGMGWSLSGSGSVARCRQTYGQDRNAMPITWSAADRFCLNGERLLVVSGSYGAPGSVYKTEIDNFARITAIGGALGHPASFKVEYKDGMIETYGDTADSAYSQETLASGKVLSWSLSKRSDSLGNKIVYHYINDVDGQRIDHIDYAFGSVSSAGAQLNFEYESRNDPISGYVAGYSTRVGKRLKNVISENGGVEIRRYTLIYNQGSAYTTQDQLSRINKIQECVGAVCSQATHFDWSIPATALPGAGVSLTLTGGIIHSEFGDINGDGLTDIVWQDRAQLVRYHLATIGSGGQLQFVSGTFGSGSTTVYSASSSSKLKIRVVDVNADGRSDVLTVNGVLLSEPRADGSWSLSEVPISVPGFVLTGQEVFNRFNADLNGDGLVDLLYASGGWTAGGYVVLAGNSYVKYRGSVGAVNSAIHNQVGAEHDLTQSLATGPSSCHSEQLCTYPIEDQPIKGVRSVEGDFNGDGRVDVLALAIRQVDCIGVDPDGAGPDCIFYFRVNPYVTEPGSNDPEAINLRLYGGADLAADTLFNGDEVGHFLAPDLNNDGLSDLVYGFEETWRYRLNTGAGFTAAQQFTLPYTHYGRPMLADINLDGHDDFVWVDGDLESEAGTPPGKLRVKYWEPATNQFSNFHGELRNEMGIYGEYEQTHPLYSQGQVGYIMFQSLRHPYENHLMMDFNGDGKPDMVRQPARDSGTVTVVLNAAGTQPANKILRIRTELGDATDIRYEPLVRTTHYNRLSGFNVSSQTQQQCLSFYDEYTYIGPTCWDVEVGVINAEDFYRNLNDPWHDLSSSEQSLRPSSPVLEALGPMYVVTSVDSSSPAASAVPDAIDDEATVRNSYLYEQARMQAGGRGFLGFKRFTVVNAQTGLRATTEFRQDWPFTGMVRKEQVVSPEGKKLSETDHIWGFVNCHDSNGQPQSGCDTLAAQNLEQYGSASLGALQLVRTKTISKQYALRDNGATQGELLSLNESTIAQDGFGNVAFERSITRDGNNALVLDKTTDNAYLYNGPTWSMQMGRLQRMDVSSTDGAQTLNRSSGFTYYTSGPVGLLKTETVEPDQPNFIVTTTHNYDAFGNKIQSFTVADGQTRTSRVEYDARGRYVDKTYERFSGNIERLINRVIARDNYGTPIEVETLVDEHTSVTAITATTAFGVPYFTADETGAFSHTTAGVQAEAYESLCTLTTVTWRKAVAAGRGEGLTCLDIRGRTLRKAARLFNGGWSVVDSEYDSLDRVIRTSEPYVLGMQSVYWTENKNHDRLGRVRLIEHPDETQTTIVYNGYTTETTNARLQTRKETINPLGQKVKVVDPLNGVTLFSYDSRGNLKTMTDPAGNTTLIGYDLRDRKISMSDPDKGSWNYRYNRFNELTCQKDGKNQLVVQSYDLRGRVVNRVDYQADSGNGCEDPEGAIESNVTWTYDSAAYGLGKLDRVVDSISDYEKQLTYDNLGRISRTRTTLRGYNNQLGDHFEKLTYDPFGRPFQVFDAARNTDSFDSNGIEYEYNAYGHLHKLKNAVVVGSLQETYYEVEQMDARGNVTQAVYGNGVTRGAGYDDRTGRALALTANTAQGYLQNLELEWDEVGNLEYRHETGLGKGLQARDLYEDFEYDAMNRLTNSDLTGDYAESITVTYNGIGNITSKTGVGSYSYNPSGPGSIRPHAVIETVGTATTTYGYDNNGNQTGDSGGRTISYSVADLPVLITKGGHTTEFFYGPDRARYKRIDTSGSSSTTTLYLGSVEKVYNPDNTIQWKRDIAGIALITQTFNSSGAQTGSDTRYLVKDHLGTLSLILDNTGAVVEELYFDAWGKRREILLANTVDIFNKPITTRGYTGHEMLDAVGLVHMNGRIYDGNLSRFVQADPIIQDPFKTESLNRYSYVWNNPLNAADPSGFSCRGNGAAGSDNTCTRQQDAEESQRKVTNDENSCSSGRCQNYAVKASDGSVQTVSINRSDRKAFEKEMSNEIAKGKTDLKNGVSYSSFSSSVSSSFSSGGGAPDISSAQQNSSPVTQGDIVAGHVAVSLIPGASTFNALADGDMEAAESEAREELVGVVVGAATVGVGYLVIKGVKAYGAYRKTKEALEVAKQTDNSIALTRARFGHAFTTHGQDATEFLTKRAAASGKPMGQFLDDQAAARLIHDNLGNLKNGAISVPIPNGFPARMIMPDGSFAPASSIRMVPSGNGVKTAYPEL